MLHKRVSRAREDEMRLAGAKRLAWAIARYCDHFIVEFEAVHVWVGDNLVTIYCDYDQACNMIYYTARLEDDYMGTLHDMCNAVRSWCEVGV